VAIVRFTRKAEADLVAIGEYTLQTWGEQQCARYLDQLEECCQRLAETSTLGRPCDWIRGGYLRMEQGSHVVFFRRDAQGIFVIRILHARMLPSLHFGDDDSDE
jgi:toxin ParE1/3/4